MSAEEAEPLVLPCTAFWANRIQAVSRPDEDRAAWADADRLEPVLRSMGMVDISFGGGVLSCSCLICGPIFAGRDWREHGCHKAKHDRYYDDVEAGRIEPFAYALEPKR